MIKKLKSLIQKPLLIVYLVIFKIIDFFKLIYILLSPFIILILIVDYFKGKKALDGYEDTKYHNMDLGHVLYITGPIGAGKSTLSAGLSNLGQEMLLDKIDYTMEKCKKIIWKIDYNKLNSFIETRRNLDMRYEEIYTDFICDPEYQKYRDGAYFDGINENNFNDLIYKYIRAYYRKLDNNFVMANINYRSRITGNYSKTIDNDNLKVKLRKMYVENYNIVFIDEATLLENNLDTSESKSEDGGKDTFLRLARNAFEGTVTVIFTAQVKSRDILMYRELATAEIAIYDFKVLEQSRAKYLIYKIKEKCLKFEKKLYMKITLSQEEMQLYDNRPNKFKEQEFRIMEKLDHISANAYLDYTALIKLERKNEISEVKLTLPINYCWGVINTHEYKFLIDYLKQVQDDSYYNQLLTNQLTNDDIKAKAEEILTSRKTAKEEKKVSREERRKENQRKHHEQQEERERRRKEALTLLLENKNSDNIEPILIEGGNQ